MKKYTPCHHWIVIENDRCVRVGISKKLADELGQIVFVDLPPLHSVHKQGFDIVVLESMKAAIDLEAPLSGKVIAVNSALKDAPEKVFLDPENEGWLYCLELSDSRELDKLAPA